MKGDRIISFFLKKKINLHKTDLHKPSFPKNPWSLCEDKWPNFDAPLSLSSLKRFLGRRYLGFKLVTIPHLFLQGLYNRCGKPSFLRVRPNIYPAVQNNAWFFFEKVFLKGTSPADHSLQQHKTVLQIVNYFFFWVFEDLHPCNSYYTILKALENSYWLLN